MKRFSQLHTEARAEDLANNARAKAPVACPPGYKFSRKSMRCEPITPKDDVSGGRSKDAHPENGPGFNVIGSHGMNGEPYAYEEPAADVSEARRMVGLPDKKTRRQPRDMEDALKMIGKNGNRGKRSPVNTSGSGNHTRRESDYIASLIPINGVSEETLKQLLRAGEKEQKASRRADMKARNAKIKEMQKHRIAELENKRQQLLDKCQSKREENLVNKDYDERIEKVKNGSVKLEQMAAGDGGFTSQAAPEGPTAGYNPVMKPSKRKSNCPRCGTQKDKCRCLSNRTLQDSDF